MSFIALLGAILTILCAGYVPVGLVLRTTRLYIAEQLALCWIFGTGIVSLLVWVFGFLARGALLPGLVAIVCVVPALIVWRMRARSVIRIPCSRKLKPIDLLLGTILALEVAIIFYLSYVHTLGGDGILNWEIKARYAYANGGVLPATYLQDSGRAFSHPEYPLAIPFTELWLYFWLGEANQFWAKTIFPLFYLSGVILIVAISARFTGKTWPGLLVASLLFLTPQISTDGGSAIVGYADFPLAVFYLGTIGYLLCACRDDDEVAFRIYAVALALLPWIKREGAVLWLAAAILGALVIWRKQKSPAHFLALLPGLFVIIGWRLYLSQMHAVASSDFLGPSLANFWANFDRVGPIVSMLFAEVTRAQIWSLFWILIAMGGVFFVHRYRDICSLVLITALAAPLAIYSSGYLFSNWPDYLEHITLSIGRLLMHIAPLAFLSVSAALASLSPQPIRSRHPASVVTFGNRKDEETAKVKFA